VPAQPKQKPSKKAVASFAAAFFLACIRIYFLVLRFLVRILGILEFQFTMCRPEAPAALKKQTRLLAYFNNPLKNDSSSFAKSA
jgi:hypothetical protein